MQANRILLFVLEPEKKSSVFTVYAFNHLSVFNALNSASSNSDCKGF